jgi:hypothetical protein
MYPAPRACDFLELSTVYNIRMDILMDLRKAEILGISNSFGETLCDFFSLKENS